MEMQKIGNLLKQLRKEKGLTQEQLAEKFYVSSRTVSRWETGNNMPDLSILVELADFYDVDLRELIEGERKEQDMNTELKDTMLKVADYAEKEKDVLIKRVRIITVIGMVAMCSALFLQGNIGPEYDMYVGMLEGVALGTLIVNLLYTTGLLAKIRARQSKELFRLKLIAICIILLSGYIISLFL